MSLRLRVFVRVKHGVRVERVVEGHLAEVSHAQGEPRRREQSPDEPLDVLGNLYADARRPRRPPRLAPLSVKKLRKFTSKQNASHLNRSRYLPAK